MNRWAGIDYLDLVPQRCVASEPAPAEGRVVLLQPRFTGRLLGRWLQPRLRGDRRWVRVTLDPRGSWIWQRIDGRSPVRELAQGFAARFPEDADDAPERVSRYVAALVAHGFARHVNVDALQASRD